MNVSPGASEGAFYSGNTGLYAFVRSSKKMFNGTNHCEPTNNKMSNPQAKLNRSKNSGQSINEVQGEGIWAEYETQLKKKQKKLDKQDTFNPELLAKTKERLIIYRLLENSKQQRPANEISNSNNGRKKTEICTKDKNVTDKFSSQLPTHLQVVSGSSKGSFEEVKLNRSADSNDLILSYVNGAVCNSEAVVCTPNTLDSRQSNWPTNYRMTSNNDEVSISDCYGSECDLYNKGELFKNGVPAQTVFGKESSCQQQVFPSDSYEKEFIAGLEQTSEKRLSKVIQVDGITYVLTLERPASTFRSLSVSTIESPKLRLHNGCYSRYPHLYNCFANGDIFNIPGRVSKEMEAWYQQRDSMSARVNVSHCGVNDVIEPYRLEALDHAALRLRNLVQSLKKNLDVPKETLRQNLEYSIKVLESNYVKLNRHDSHPPFDDEMLDNLSRETPVPEEIKSWLVETFSNKKLGNEKTRLKKDRRTLRSVVRTLQAGMIFDRISRKPVADLAQEYLGPEVVRHLKNIDKWTFDVFELENISNGNALSCIGYQLLTKYDLMKRFKIPAPSFFAYCTKLQRGYRKHNNHYHNPVHAADVAQTLNCLLTESGFINWFSDLEIFSMIMAALVHDVEHTGTTNNFHINTRSNLAFLYNDRSVLEQHHISTAFRIMQEDGCNILTNFSKDDYQDCRSLMVDMVLATDMNQHFEQTQNMEASLERPDLLEKSKAMCLLLHSSDINHPSKPWDLHYRWTEQLMIEFFEQGDQERKRDLAISPLCDRHSAKIAQSQIGFIDFVIKPTFSLLLRMFDEVNVQAIASINVAKSNAQLPGDSTPASGDILKCRFGYVDTNSIAKDFENGRLDELREILSACMSYNRSQWIRKDKIEREKKLFGENSFRESFTSDPLPSEILKYFENGEIGKPQYTFRSTNGSLSKPHATEKSVKSP